MYVSMYRGAGMPIYTKLIARENEEKVILMTTTKFYGYKTILISKKDTVVCKKASETTTTSLHVPTKPNKTPLKVESVLVNERVTMHVFRFRDKSILDETV